MYSNIRSMNCVRFLTTLVLTITINRFSSGQPLPSDRRLTVESALMEQRVLQQIRPLVTGLCDDRTYARHLSELTEEIHALTTRVVEIEETLALSEITVCSDYLVSGLYGVEDSALTASTRWTRPGHFYYGAKNSRLYNERNETGRATGAWSPEYNNIQQVVQVKFPREVDVDTIWLRGRIYPALQWVETYRVLYSSDGTTWTPVMSTNHQPRLFPGNNDRNTIVKSSLDPSITATYLRINPRSWHNHISLRFDVGGRYIVRETRQGYKPVLNGGTLYKVNERGHNQLDATRLCTQQYSQLIKVDSLSLMTGLQAVVNGNAILRNAHNQMYVSGRYALDSWRYSDGGSDVIDSALWSPGNPDPSLGHCVMLTTTGLASVDCHQTLSVCGHI